MPRTYRKTRKYTRKARPFRTRYTRNRKLYRRPHRELKYVDDNLGGANIAIPDTPANAAMRFLNPVAQGTGEDQRIGRSITAQSINLKFFIQFSAGGNAFQKVHWMLYLHHDVQGAPPSTASMFAVDTVFNPLPNLDQPKYGRILKSGTATLDVYHGQRTINVYKRLYFRSTWHDDTDGIADMSRNSLYLILWGDQTAANYPVMTQGNSRFKYYDN